MHWTFMVDPEGRSGVTNMATDYALLRRARQGVGFVRVYRWDPPCLSFGRNEPATRRYDLDKIKEMGIDTVRRPTGGRAVWHENEVTYAVAAPTSVFGSLREGYCEIHRVIAKALKELGAEVTLADSNRPALGLGAGACFAAPVGGEVISGDQKLVGSAQFRVDDTLLQHGSILLENQQDIIASISRGAAAPNQAGGLNSVLKRNVGFSEVADQLHSAVTSEWHGDWSVENGAHFETECYNFDDPDWTWRR
jgi:lipoate-protein ligase A